MYVRSRGGPGAVVCWSQDLARLNSKRDASQPERLPLHKFKDATGAKRWCRIPGFISSEISGVFTLRARGRHVKMLCGMVYGLSGFRPTTGLVDDKSTYATATNAV